MASKYKIVTLKSRADFLRIKKNGHTVIISHWLLANYSENQDQGLRVGWTIPVYVGTAVVRNRIKRWIRQYLITPNSRILKLNIDINLVFRKRDVKFYRELSHGSLDLALESTFKKIYERAQ